VNLWVVMWVVPAMEQCSAHWQATQELAASHPFAWMDREGSSSSFPSTDYLLAPKAIIPSNYILGLDSSLKLNSVVLSLPLKLYTLPMVFFFPGLVALPENPTNQRISLFIANQSNTNLIDGRKQSLYMNNKTKHVHSMFLIWYMNCSQIRSHR